MANAHPPATDGTMARLARFAPGLPALLGYSRTDLPMT